MTAQRLRTLCPTTLQITAEARLAGPKPLRQSRPRREPTRQPGCPGGKTSSGPLGSGGAISSPSDTQAPRPRFNCQAYNGAPMRLDGWRFPVIVDGRGVKAAAEHIRPTSTMRPTPASRPNASSNCWARPTASPSTRHGLHRGLRPDHRRKATWSRTPSPTPRTVSVAVLDQRHSLGLRVPAENVSSTVNGRAVTGPLVIARAVTVDHIALVRWGRYQHGGASCGLARRAAKGN